jgi:hypothetical protein
MYNRRTLGMRSPLAAWLSPEEGEGSLRAGGCAASQTKVEDLDMTRGSRHDVARLEVAADNAPGLRRVARLGDFPSASSGQNEQRLAGSSAPARLKPALQHTPLS